MLDFGCFLNRLDLDPKIYSLRSLRSRSFGTLRPLRLNEYQELIINLKIQKPRYAGLFIWMQG